jgi:hypothetical protein
MSPTRFFTNKQCKEDSVSVPFFDNESCCVVPQPDPPIPCVPIEEFFLCNPSFEGTPVIGNGSNFDPNIQCWKQFQNDTPDILPISPFLTPASDGVTYIGLIAGGLPPDTYLPGEAIYQQLPFVLPAAGLIYTFNIDTIELTSQIWTPGFGFGVLELWGGNSPGVLDELLWTSPLINQGVNWITFLVTFTPIMATHNHLFFRFVRTQGTSCFIGIDNMTEISSQCPPIP